MVDITRAQLKVLFKKVKHLRLPENLETVSFEALHYYGWFDASDDVYYLLTEVDNQIIGLKGEINRMPTRLATKHMCSICLREREFSEVMLFTAKNKRLPKGVDYRVTGVYICKDYVMCNAEMKDATQIQKFFRLILEG
jgi:hypothetical protein